MSRDVRELPQPIVVEPKAVRQVKEARGFQDKEGVFTLFGGYSYPAEWNEEGGWLVVGEDKGKPRFDLVCNTGAVKWKIGVTGSEQQGNVAKIVVDGSEGMLGKTVHLTEGEQTAVLIALPNRGDEEPIVWMDQVNPKPDRRNVSGEAQKRLERMAVTYPEMDGLRILVLNLEQHISGQVVVDKIGTGFLNLDHLPLGEVTNKDGEDEAKVKRERAKSYPILKSVSGRQLEIKGRGLKPVVTEVRAVTRKTLTQDEQEANYWAKIDKERKKQKEKEEMRKKIGLDGSERPLQKKKTIEELQREVENMFKVKVYYYEQSGNFSVEGDHVNLRDLLLKGMVTKGAFSYHGPKFPRERAFSNYIPKAIDGSGVASIREWRNDSENDRYAVEVKPLEGHSKEKTLQFMREFMRNAVVGEPRRRR